MRNAWFKGHGLGNDYIAVDPEELDFKLTRTRIRALCDRHLGVGSDGLLVLTPSARAHFGLRIFNPDGSEAEKSGNGLRIFGCFLHATRRTRRRRLTVETTGGLAELRLELDPHGDVRHGSVDMGRASFRPEDLPCTLDVEELVDQPVRAGALSLRFTGVSIGNPHCVVFRSAARPWTQRDLRKLGPLLETHRIFPAFSNVQLAVVSGRRALSLLIWERGAGATLSSGSSACAAACAAIRAGRVESPVTVRMPGGSLEVEVSADYDVTLSGPVEALARGQLAEAFVRRLQR